MGKVFRWEEIVVGKIPQIESFPKVVHFIEDTFQGVDDIIGAVICGSVLRGDHNIRSDIDCVVLYSEKCGRSAQRAFWEVGKFAGGLHVPLELIPVEQRIAATSLNSIGLEFAEHLRFAAKHGGVIKENPLDFIAENEGPLEDVKSYIRARIRRLEKAFSGFPVLNEWEYFETLQKALEAPVNIARTILWWCGVELPNDSKRDVIREYYKIGTVQEVSLFHFLLELDRCYSETLEQQIRTPEPHEYAATLESIKAAVWDSLEFVRLSALRVERNDKGSLS